jgi:Leucine-rich repeat (LRR) protein
VLDPRGNELPVVPDWLGNLTTLTSLDLTGVPLTTLTRLDPSDTRLADLPHSIGRDKLPPND